MSVIANAPASPSRVARTDANRRFFRNPVFALLAPAMTILLAMTIAPAIYIFGASLFNFELMNANAAHFVGLGNYIETLTNPAVWWGLAATLLFVVLAVGLELLLGLVVALLLSRKIPEGNLLSALFILPMAMTPAVSALIWRELLDPNFGWVSYYLQAWHLTAVPIAWLSDPVTSWVALIALNVWQWTPFVALILLAGLQGIPADLREAASIDGAGGIQFFFNITLPLLQPFIAIALLLRVIDAFKTFDIIQVLTGGGPGTATETINLMIYRTALQDFNVGAASALGVCFLIFLMIVVQRLMKAFPLSTQATEV
jgi:multiple sugar transport system permease protein